MFSDPQKNIEQLGLMPGHKVADLGSGSGFYTFAAAQAVGSVGTVYAVDVQQDLLTKIKNEAGRQNLLNVETIWGDAETEGGTKLGDGSVDAVIVANVLFQAESRHGLLKEAARIAKRGGKVLVVDWMESFGGMGPHPDHVVTKDAARELAAGAGLKEEREITAGAHHYGFIFTKQ